jgi:ubiquinone/menaquinone biosynthesis C-methylase UbiE
MNELGSHQIPRQDPSSAHFDEALLDELRFRVDRLAEVFDFARLQGRGSSAGAIKQYYEDSRLGYWFVHSKEGAMHMALNPNGTFDEMGYRGQAWLVRDRVREDDRDILELACGNGFNLNLLAQLFEDRRFVGIDLVESQIVRGNKLLASRPNARAEVGDFQDLQFEDSSQDLVFVIESFCHATDLERALSEQHRVLREGGRFIVIDAWRTDLFAAAPPFVQEAAANVEQAMAVSKSLSLEDWIDTAARAGFRVTESLDLSEQIKPNLARLARGADKYLSHRRVASVARLLLPDTLIENAIAGYLMPLTVDLKLHTYRLLCLARD